MAGISKSEAAVRRAAKNLIAIHGKDKTEQCNAAARLVAKFIGGLSDVGLHAYLELHQPADVTAIAKSAHADRVAAKAARKAAKAAPASVAA